MSLLALGIAAGCWLLAGLAGDALGIDGYWPLDRVLAVFAGLSGLEAILQRRQAAH